MLSPRFPGLLLEPMIVTIEPGGPLEDAVAHDGEEFAYVISGELLYEVAGREHRLGPGDSVFLRSNTPHRLYNDGSVTTVVISVVTPRYY
jgi:quercetin dioxygenase-like cupin family protein